MKKVFLTLLFGLFFVAFSNAQSTETAKEEVTKEVKAAADATSEVVNAAEVTADPVTEEKACCKGKKGGKSCKGKKDGKSCKGKDKAECKKKKAECKKKKEEEKKN